MKKTHTLLLLATGMAVIAATIDLNKLENYSAQNIPNYITKDNTPPNNVLNDKHATLGRILFYDKKLSANNTVSCGSCHKQQFAFGDTASASTGAFGNTGRHAMRLVNARFSNEVHFFWDERAQSLEQQTTMPIQNHEEMGYSGQNGDPSINDLIVKLGNTWYYPQLFKWVYGDSQITEQRMQFALSQFVRSIQSFDSKFDAGRAVAGADNTPFSNFTAQENTGKALFLAPPQFNGNGMRTGGGAGCAGCHAPPEFSIVPNSLNNGVTGSFAGGSDLDNTRSPSLRDVVDANGNPYGGFMHNAGQNNMPTLLDVINHYNLIPADNAKLDNKLKPGGHLQQLQLTVQEKDALVAFVKTLTGSDVYTNPKWSDPFTNDSLTLTNIPSFIQSLAQANALRIYPNPNNGIFTIALPDGNKDALVSIVDLSGKIVKQATTTGTSLQVDISYAAKGIYQLIVYKDGKSYSSKVAVQ